MCQTKHSDDVAAGTTDLDYHMKRKFAIAIGVVLFCLFVWYCTPIRYFNLLDHYGPSNSIEESKHRNVYLFRYKVKNKQPIILGDGITLTIDDSWVERQWKAGTFDNETIVYYDIPAEIRSCIRFEMTSHPKLPEWAREIVVPDWQKGRTYAVYDPLDTTFGRRWYFTYLLTASLPPTELSIPILRRNDSTKTVWVSADTIGWIHLEADDW